MQNNNFKYFHSWFGRQAIIAYIAVLLICIYLFPNKLPLLWIFAGILAVSAFFYFTWFFTLKWKSIPDKLFRRKLFNTALIIRLVYVAIIYFYYQSVNGNPFEFYAADSMGYHEEALWIINLFKANMLDYYYSEYATGVSDSGWPILLSMIYFFLFKSIFIARLVNASLSAWMVLLIYRLAQRNFSQSAARITAVMAMLLPTFIFYSGLHLKETSMVFVLVAFAERADLILHSRRIHWSLILQTVLLGVALFFFRTVLAVAAWFALFSALLFTSRRILNVNIRVISFIWFVVATFIVFSGRIMMEVEAYAEARFINQQNRLYQISTGKGANELAKLGSTTIFLPMMLPGPFPTLVNIESQKNAMMINGANFTRNVYVFFVLLALWMMIKNKLLRQNIFILAVLFGYLFILASSGFALSERFHMPALPFLLILAGYGVTVTNRRYASYYIPYIIIIGVLVVAWNWFKLAGRGIV
jgi:hypothetical protein